MPFGRYSAYQHGSRFVYLCIDSFVEPSVEKRKRVVGKISFLQPAFGVLLPDGSEVDSLTPDPVSVKRGVGMCGYMIG